jgi:imidazolonepropionase-like amidohydrolase
LSLGFGPPLRAQEAGRPAERPAILFSGVTVLDGLGSDPRKGDVAISDGRIGVGGLSGARRVEVEGAFLAPGFVEAAARLGYARDEGERTRELTAWVDARDLADPTNSAFREAAREGCTTVVLVPGPSNVVGGLSQAFHAWSPDGRAVPIEGAPKSLHGSVSGWPSRGNFPPRFRATTSIYARRPTTRMGVVWMLRQVFLQARGEQPVSNDADLTPYREVLDGKRRCRLLLHRLQDINAALRLADEADFEVVLEGAEEAYLVRERLARRKVPVLVGPLPDERTGVGPESTDTALRNPSLLHDAGVVTALTTGAAGARWLREHGMWAARYGIPREAALAAVTSIPADICGLRDRGRIENGAAADVVLWSGHPLLPTSRALMVVVDGWVVHDGTKER